MSVRMLSLLSLALAAAGCSSASAKPRRGAKVERLVKLEVVEPARKRIQRRIEVAAVVEAMQKVEMSARVPGVVKTLDPSMDVGRKVKEGEVMLALAVPDLDAELAQKQASLRQAEANKRVARESWAVADKEVDETRKEDKKFEAEVEFARSRLARIAKLVRERAQEPAVEEEAKKQLDAARSSLAANQSRVSKREARVAASAAEYDLAEERIKVARAELTKAAEMVGFATVRAPFDGVIVRRYVDSGAVTKDSGTLLFTFMQMDRVRVLIDVPQRDVALLDARDAAAGRKGDPVVVSVPALSELPNRGRYEGEVTRVSRSLDAVTRTMRAEIDLNNPSHDLRPGMFGSASVLVEDRPGVLTVPASAVVRREAGTAEVYVVDVAPDTAGKDERRGVLRLRPVVLGIDDGKEVEIREGLTGGELVVARSTGAMRANDAVLAVRQTEAEK